MPNRLIHEKSPYLLQHANQPVDWYPWTQEAFDRATKEDKPIFLSIGYSTCHWCHVMAHESFDDEEVAEILNRCFVSIKVDREERPDVDHVYMTFCQLMRGNCGWPLSVFMTPDRKPFFIGTYFPKRRRSNLEGFLDILEKICYLWTNNRKAIEQTADSIFKLVNQATETLYLRPRASKISQPAREEILHRAYRNLERSFDSVWGGFGSPPKFPTPHQLRFLLRYYNRYDLKKALVMVEKTLDGMASGGIYDQLGGGFHRYSVDREWIVPHFEKMLYDQALIPMAYLEAWQVTKNPAYEEIVIDTLDFVLEEFTSPEGGFYSAQDADVDGKEGEYYIWTREEIIDILGSEKGNKACLYWGVEGESNFEGRFVLTRSFDRHNALKTGTSMLLTVPSEIKQVRQELLRARKNRPKPSTDNKILTSWNGLMISMLARAGNILKRPEYIAAAERSCEFIFSNLMDPNGARLHRSYCEGAVISEAFLEDYAFFIQGLLELFFATSKPALINRVYELTDQMISLFWDDQNKGFYFTPKHSTELPIRSKDLFDGATPSGNSVAFENLLLLSRISEKGRYEEMVADMLDVFEKTISEAPVAYTHFICGIDRYIGPSVEITLLPDDGYTYVREIRERLNEIFLPRTILLASTGGVSKTKVQICKDRVCLPPIDADKFLNRLSEEKAKEALLIDMPELI